MLQPFRLHKGRVAVLDRDNVDTDQIIPKQFLKRIERTGYGRYAFFDWRYKGNGEPDPEFELNRPGFAGSTILIAGENFGCGSSREHAPWALGDYGFRVIIAPSFADIFHQNCLKNGILPIRLNQDKVTDLMDKANSGSQELTVNLADQTVWGEAGLEAAFEIDPHWKDMLLNGRDEIAYTLMYEESIRVFEESRI
ncbi:3-isopropylmalate dehydratase small subunit [Bacillus sp. FJAT-42376]|uniref:3-isopropylmalate dehydratase small subunit n=1 Tax=Bacillus sp. FJAT-42376 TaxID=2014076 RepID=UPI000F50EE05|nr:3-isopropylmalate dehydratase small subunit [Bacillus sp. FJAT-42376]AZB43839.1 3-isopropylmalate dehydratase small subunit [Bacillus sp. FJAT-42376]